MEIWKNIVLFCVAGFTAFYVMVILKALRDRREKSELVKMGIELRREHEELLKMRKTDLQQCTWHEGDPKNVFLAQHCNARISAYNEKVIEYYKRCAKYNFRVGNLI